MSSRRSSIALQRSDLQKSYPKGLRDQLPASATTMHPRLAESNKQRTSSAGREKRPSIVSASKRSASITPRNQPEPNSVKNRRLLAELLQDPPTEVGKDDTRTEKQGQSLWKELVHIKDRLEKLEVIEDDPSTPVIANSARISPALPRRMTVQQKRLQSALEVYEGSRPRAMTRAMSAVVAEAIYMNQQLWQSIPRELDAKTLVALQKSSDGQLKALTETLLELCRQSPSPLPSPPIIAITSSLLTSQSSHQQQQKQPPVSKNCNSSCSSNSSMIHRRRRSFKTTGTSEPLAYPDTSVREAPTINKRSSDTRYANYSL
ncbi:hypothetical protein BX666DRAFT_1921520 [Dichotomocladium elegans]|nr:hypothetical protein BX666DRAFT_1921520 [Dichotomocladium elegans]